MKIKLLSSISIAVLAATLSTANATDFNYSYVEGAYQDIDLNGVDSEAFDFLGSYDVVPGFNVIAGYATGKTDNMAGGSDLDFDTLSLGLGYHAPVAENTDFTANLKLIKQDMDLVGDDTGYGFGIGVRHMLTDTIEVGSNIDFVDIYDADDTTFRVDSRFFVNKEISLGLAYSTSSEEVDIFSAGVRFDF